MPLDRSGGVDGQTLEAFEAQLNQQLERLQRQLKEDTYQPLPVRQHPIPKRDKPGEHRMLGIPAIYDRVCQQALLNRLEPIFEPIFDDASFGYRRGRSPKDALRKVWKEIHSGSEWIVDADLRDFFGSADHEKLLTLVAQRVADDFEERIERFTNLVFALRHQHVVSVHGPSPGNASCAYRSDTPLAPDDGRHLSAEDFYGVQHFFV